MVYIATLSVEQQSIRMGQQDAWNELESLIAEMQQNAAQSGLSPTQIDEIIDDETAAVRYGREP